MEAEARIKSAKEDAISGIRDSATDVASTVTERLIGVTLPAEMVVAAVNNVLKKDA